MNDLTTIVIFIYCVFMIIAVNFILWSLYRVFKYLIETVINLHDLGR